MPRIYALGNRTKQTYTILVLIVALIGSLCTPSLATQAQTKATMGSKGKPNPNQYPYYANIPFTKAATEIPKYRKAVERLGGVMDCQFNEYDKKRLDNNGGATTYDCVKLVVVAQCKDYNGTRIRMLFEESLLALKAYGNSSIKSMSSYFDKVCLLLVNWSKEGGEINAGKGMLDMRYTNFRNPSQEHTNGFTQSPVFTMNGDAAIVYIRGNEKNFDTHTLFHEIAHAVVQYGAIYGTKFPKVQYPHQELVCTGERKRFCNESVTWSLREGHAVYTECSFKKIDNACLNKYKPGVKDNQNCLEEFIDFPYLCAYYTFKKMQIDFNNTILPQHKNTIQKNPNFLIKEILKETKTIDSYDALKEHIKHVFRTYTTNKNYNVDYAKYWGNQQALKQILEAMRAYDKAQMKKANQVINPSNKASKPKK